MCVADRGATSARYAIQRLGVLRSHREGSGFRNHAVALAPWLSKRRPLLHILHSCGVSGAGTEGRAVLRRFRTGESRARTHCSKGMEILKASQCEFVGVVVGK